jgi:hypothetical protein
VMDMAAPLSLQCVYVMTLQIISHPERQRDHRPAGRWLD